MHSNYLICRSADVACKALTLFVDDSGKDHSASLYHCRPERDYQLPDRLAPMDWT